MTIFQLPDRKYPGDRDRKELEKLGSEFKSWVLTKTKYPTEASAITHRIVEFYSYADNTDLGKVERIWDMRMYFGIQSGYGGGQGFSRAVKLHNEFLVDSGKDPIHPENVNINVNMCLPDPLAHAADLLYVYAGEIDPTLASRGVFSLKRDHWYSIFDELRDRDKFCSKYSNRIKNIDALCWALGCLDLYNIVQPVRLSPAFILGKGRSLFYSRLNVGTKPGGSPRRRMLEIIEPLFEVLAPYKVIEQMVDNVAVRKDHIGNYLNWTGFYETYMKVINRKTEGCFSEALDLVKFEFNRGYSDNRREDANKVEYNRFGIELPPPAKQPEVRDFSVRIDPRVPSFTEQMEIMEAAQKEIQRQEPVDLEERPKIIGPYTSYLQTMREKQQESDNIIGGDFRVETPVGFTFEDTPKKRGRPKKGTPKKHPHNEDDYEPTDVASAFLLLREQMATSIREIKSALKSFEKFLMDSGHIQTTTEDEESIDEPIVEEEPVEEIQYPRMTDGQFEAVKVRLREMAIRMHSMTPAERAQVTTLQVWFDHEYELREKENRL